MKKELKEYLVEFSMDRLVKKNGKDGKKRKGEVVIKATSESAAKHKFYAKHSCLKGYMVTSIDEMLKEKK